MGYEKKFNLYFIFLFNLIKLINNLPLINIKKEDIIFIISNQKCLIQGINFDYNSEISLSCKTKDNNDELYFPFLSNLNNSILFYLNYSKYKHCEINSIKNHNNKIFYSKNQKPVFNFSELIILINNIQINKRIIESPIKLDNYYLRNSSSFSKIILENQTNKKYIYSFKNENNDLLLLCKSNICINLNKNKLRKLDSVPSIIDVSNPTYSYSEGGSQTYSTTLYFNQSILNNPPKLIQFIYKNNIIIRLQKNNFTIFEDSIRISFNQNIINKKVYYFSINITFEDNSTYSKNNLILFYINLIQVINKELNYLRESQNQFIYVKLKEPISDNIQISKISAKKANEYYYINELQITNYTISDINQRNLTINLPSEIIESNEDWNISIFDRANSLNQIIVLKVKDIILPSPFIFTVYPDNAYNKSIDLEIYICQSCIQTYTTNYSIENVGNSKYIKGINLNIDTPKVKEIYFFIIAEALDFTFKFYSNFYKKTIEQSYQLIDNIYTKILEIEIFYSDIFNTKIEPVELYFSYNNEQCLRSENPKKIKDIISYNYTCYIRNLPIGDHSLYALSNDYFFNKIKFDDIIFSISNVIGDKFLKKYDYQIIHYNSGSQLLEFTFTEYFQIERIGLVSTTSQKCNSQELTIKCEFLEIPPVNVDNEFNVTFFDKEMNYYEYNVESNSKILIKEKLNFQISENNSTRFTLTLYSTNTNETLSKILLKAPNDNYFSTTLKEISTTPSLFSAGIFASFTLTNPEDYYGYEMYLLWKYKNNKSAVEYIGYFFKKENINFYFNHLYFVINDESENKLEIKVNKNEIENYDLDIYIENQNQILTKNEDENYIIFDIYLYEEGEHTFEWVNITTKKKNKN